MNKQTELALKIIDEILNDDYDYPDEAIPIRVFEALQACKEALEQPAQEQDWCPDKCPITQLPFFTWIEHPTKGYVPTYGGVYDSYTIPELIDGEYLRERYDHDEGSWKIDEYENVGVQIVDDQLYVSETPPAEQPAQEPVAWTTQEQLNWLSNELNNCSLMWNSKSHEKTGLKSSVKFIPLYTHPCVLTHSAPAWQGLTWEEIEQVGLSLESDSWHEIAHKSEQALKEKNYG